MAERGLSLFLEDPHHPIVHKRIVYKLFGFLRLVVRYWFIIKLIFGVHRFIDRIVQFFLLLEWQLRLKIKTPTCIISVYGSCFQNIILFSFDLLISLDVPKLLDAAELAIASFSVTNVSCQTAKAILVGLCLLFKYILKLKTRFLLNFVHNLSVIQITRVLRYTINRLRLLGHEIDLWVDWNLVHHKHLLELIRIFIYFGIPCMHKCQSKPF